MSSFVFSIAFLFFISFALIEGATPHKNSSGFGDPKIAGKESRCEWPGEFFLSGPPALEDSAGFDKWLKKIQPQAIRNWMQCSEPLSKKDATRKLRQMKKAFEDSGGVEELETHSGCGKSEIMALFETNSSAKQVKHAVTCILEGMEKPVSRFPVMVRVDEDCERNKRNMIRSAQNRVIAGGVAAVAAGTCCAFAVPWCAVLAGLLAAEAAAIADLASARQFECPKCSDPPSARMVTGHDMHGIPNHYMTGRGSAIGIEGKPSI